MLPVTWLLYSTLSTPGMNQLEVQADEEPVQLESNVSITVASFHNPSSCFCHIIHKRQ